MRHFFIKNLFFVIAVNLLVKPVWVLLIDRTVQNRVGHEAYGTYQPLLNLCIIFQILLDFGLTYYNTKVISEDPNRLKDFFPAMLSTRLLFMVVYTVVVVSTGWLLGYHTWEMLLLGGILLIQALASLMQFIRSNLAALHKFKADALLSVSDKLLMIVVCGFLLFYPGTAALFRIDWFVWAQVSCYVVAVCIAVVVLKRISGVHFRFSLDAVEVSRILKESLPYASLVFLMAIHMRIDSVLLERMAGKDEAGIYAAAYRLLDVGNMFGLMFAGVLLPIFGRMLGNKENTTPIVRLSVNLLLPIAFIIAIIAASFGGDIMSLLYTDAGTYDGAVFGWLMGAFPAFCMMYVFSTLLTANGNLILLNKIATMGVIINLALNFWLISKEQALGAAIAACITQSFLAVCYIGFSSSTFRIPIDGKWLASHAGFILLAAATGYMVAQLPLRWELRLVLVLAVCTAYLFLFRFVSVDAIKQLATKRQA